MGVWTMRIGVTALVTAVTRMAATAATAAPAERRGYRWVEEMCRRHRRR
jgi:hypothetical protein